MDQAESTDSSIDLRIAQRLKAMRGERKWSLDELAQRSKVSRATLSRLESAQVSPTASVLGKLCAVYGMTMSRLMHMVEDGFAPVVRHDAQPVWKDASIGFERRSISPPAQSLAGEVVECVLGPGTRVTYGDSPRPGLEHHLILVEGRLEVSVGGQSHDLQKGDCLRYQLSGPSEFATPARSAARYLIFLV